LERDHGEPDVQAGRSTLKKGVPLWEQAQREFEVRIGAAEARDLRNLLQSF
jgi:hypothetical protein